MRVAFGRVQIDCDYVGSVPTTRGPALEFKDPGRVDWDRFMSREVEGKRVRPAEMVQVAYDPATILVGEVLEAAEGRFLFFPWNPVSGSDKPCAQPSVDPPRVRDRMN